MNTKIKMATVMLSVSSAIASTEPMKAFDPFVKENVEATDYSNEGYAYAPATVYHDGYFHQFYCSTGNMTDRYFVKFNTDRHIALINSWDHIRYRYSKNGSVWSGPFIAVTQSPGNSGEGCACDPAVVHGGDGYWYMLYAGNRNSPYYTDLYLARSKNIQGPYEKYSAQNGWDRWVENPTPVLKKNYPPSQYFAFSVKPYGIGQPTIIKKDGKIHVWFTEMNNVNFKIKGTNELYAKRYHVVVDNLLQLLEVNMDNLSAGRHVDKIKDNSSTAIDKNDRTKWHFADFGEVRWNTANNRYEMWQQDKYLGEGTRIKKYYSTNGIDWNLDNNYSEGPFNFVHNLGVSGDAFGVIYNDQYLLSFSGPEGSLHYSAQQMDRMGYVDDSEGRVGHGYWPMYQILNGKNWGTSHVNYANASFMNAGSDKQLEYFVGDFDGDGIDELGAVEMLPYGKLRWYLRSSKNSSGQSSIWGTNWSSISKGGVLAEEYKIVSGDYDGDGITDFGVVLFYIEEGKWNAYWRIHSSKTGEMGVPSIPSNWVWLGLTPSYVLLNGDYDGDGKVDLAAFLPGTKKWYMLSSMDGALMNFRNIARTKSTQSVDLFDYAETGISATSIKPIVGDFDGDHIADLAIVDTARGSWFIRSSQTGEHLKTTHNSGLSFGECVLERWPLYMLLDVRSKNSASMCNLAIPNQDFRSYKFLTGDFDGDGIDDQLVVNRNDGSTKYILSKGGLHNYSGQLAGANILALVGPIDFVVGDFDGNGYSDICLINKTPNSYIIYFHSAEGIEQTSSRDVKYVSFTSSPFLPKKSVEPSEPKAAPAKPAPGFNVNVEGQKLIVSNTTAGQRVAVFDMLGKELNRKISNGGNLTFETPTRGMYIVRAGSMQRMITVK